MLLKLKRLCPDAIPPTRAYEGAAGLDLYTIKDYYIHAGRIQVVEIGWAMEVEDPNLCTLMYSRGGYLVHRRLMALPTLLDPDYRGDFGPILYNFGSGLQRINKGDRVAQVIFTEFHFPVIHVVETLSETERSDNRFSSTGL